jgi:hypothetical protein
MMETNNNVSNMFEFNQSNNFHNNTNEKLREEWSFVVPLSTFYIFLSLLCIFTNSLIIWIIVNMIRSKKMENVTNYFICNLAVADILIGVFVAPFQVIFLL